MKSLPLFAFFLGFLCFFSCKNDSNSYSKPASDLELSSDKSIYKDENYKLVQAVDLGDFTPFGLTKFKEHILVSDTVNKVVLRYNTLTSVIDTICQKKIGYMNSEKARISLPDLNEGAVHVFRGVPELYTFKVDVPLKRPICFSGKRIDDYVMVDQGLHRMVINQSGVFRTIGQKGNGPQDFNKPSMVTYLESGIYVVDTGNKRIKVYNHMAEYQYSFGGNLLERPTSISYNGNKIFVCDIAKKEILIFSLNGEYEYSFRKELVNPTAVYGDGNTVVVSDTTTEEIKIFERDLTKI